MEYCFVNICYILKFRIKYSSKYEQKSHSVFTAMYLKTWPVLRFYTAMSDTNFQRSGQIFFIQIFKWNKIYSEYGNDYIYLKY